MKAQRAALSEAGAAGRDAGPRRRPAGSGDATQVAVVAVGAIIGRTATATDASYLDRAATLVALLLAHAGVARLRFLPGVARLTDPPRVVLVRDGQVQRANLRRSGITDADLEVLLSERGAPPVSTISLAVLEPRGAVTLVLEPRGLQA